MAAKETKSISGSALLVMRDYLIGVLPGANEIFISSAHQRDHYAQQCVARGSHDIVIHKKVRE
jgi:hypothetical protein